MVNTKLNLSMTEPSVRQIYAKQGDTGRVLDISLDQTPEDGTLRILRPDGVEVTSEANLASDTYNVQTTPYYSGETTDLGMVMGTIEGKSEQDLNGQSAPYPAGGGKNLCPNVGWAQGQIGSNGRIGREPYSISSDFILLHAGEYTISRHYDYLGNVGSGNLAYHTYDLNKNHLSDSGWLPNNYSFSISEDLYIRITTRFTMNGVDITPAIVDDGFWCQIELGSTATAWTPYSNICPITSFSTTEFVSEGKNLLDTSTVTVSGITFTQDDEGLLSASPNNTDPRPWGYDNSQYKVTLPKGSYTIVVEVDTVTSSTSNALIVVNKDGTRLTNFVANPFGTVGIKTASFTLTDETSFGVMAKQYSAVYRMMIVASGASTSFEPYQSSTASVSLTLRSLPDGTCDTYEDGVVTRRVGVVRVDGTLNYYNPDTSGVCYVVKHDMKRMTNYANSILCDSLKARESRFMSNYAYGISGYEGPPAAFPGQNWLYFKVDEITTRTEIKEFFTNNPVYAYYPLATPTTETVTIPTLVTYENYTYVHNDSKTDPTSIEYKAIMLESGQVAIPSEATEIVGKCYCDVEQNGVSSMPFTLNVKKNERQ